MSPSLDISSIAFFGRTFDEYVRMFDLDSAALPGRRIADVAAGPSSFAAEALGRGIDATAIDPLYGLSADALAAHIQLDYARMLSAMRRKPDGFRFGFFASLEAAEASRRSAAERFLADYGDGFAQGRYVGASLPFLPFGDVAFDLVLCAHLLFLYARQFDFEAHLAFCRELLRIAREEVRIHPLCGLDGLPYPELDRLRRQLDAAGIASEVLKVDYEFFAGTDTTLVLRRRS